MTRKERASQYRPDWQCLRRSRGSCHFSSADNSRLSIALRDIRTVEARSLDTKKIAWVVAISVVAYQLLRIVFMYLAFATEAT